MFRIVAQNRHDHEVRSLVRFGSIVEAITVAVGLRADLPDEVIEVRHPDGRLVTRGEAAAALACREVA